MDKNLPNDKFKNACKNIGNIIGNYFKAVKMVMNDSRVPIEVKRDIQRILRS